VKRAAIAIVLVAVVAVAVLAVRGMGGGDDPYLVRAVFDNAAFVIPGEDVKVAGVKVGAIDSLGLTANHKAVVVLRVDDPAFRPFRRDAHCIIRPQSLIGEQFVECSTTSAKPGAALPPPLPTIASGPGRGQHLLPVAQTTTPVALDLVTDTLRLPWRQRLTLIVNDLGAGLAGNGSALSAAIRRADPALQQTDRVLAILAGQNRTLGDLVNASDRVLAPLAARRRRVAHLIGQTATTARAVASRGGDLERDLRLFPPFLRQLIPTANRLGATADQAIPALADLHAQAPSINRFVTGTARFTRAAIPALRTLGNASEVGRSALTAARPTVRQLRDFAGDVLPLAENLAGVAGSFERAGGIGSALATFFNQSAATNGYDKFGHYLRAGLIVNTCESYAANTSIGGPACSSRFSRDEGATTSPGARTVAAGPRSPATVDRELLDFLIGKGSGR
jgi:phospholipid/cholesterol/gamma-HCH transport system substrate-binding protein